MPRGKRISVCWLLPSSGPRHKAIKFGDYEGKDWSTTRVLFPWRRSMENAVIFFWIMGSWWNWFGDSWQKSAGSRGCSLSGVSWKNECWTLTSCGLSPPFAEASVKLPLATDAFRLQYWAVILETIQNCQENRLQLEPCPFHLQLPDILVSGLDNQLYVNGKFDWGGIIAHKMRAKFPQYGGSQGAPRDVKLAVVSWEKPWGCHPWLPWFTVFFCVDWTGCAFCGLARWFEQKCAPLCRMPYFWWHFVRF